MFELSDKAIEKIVFAMEDQERASVVDLESGEILPAEGKEGDGYAQPPPWSSREGFHLMEEFLSSVRVPSARRELAVALARGRGVFKAFKAVLIEYPELERAFRDYKIRAMRHPISLWYDDIRESLGLQRIGPEPEDTAELLTSELDLRTISWDEARAVVSELLDEAEEECLDILPAPIVAFELNRLKTELAEVEDGIGVIVGDGEGGALGIGLAIREFVGERGFGRIAFLWVKRDFRRMGLGSAILGALSERLAKEGISLVVLDSAFLPAEIGSRLAAIGYTSFGLRCLSRKD